VSAVGITFFNGHFPGEPGLAGFTEAKEDGSGGDNWSYKTRAKLQSNCHHQRTNPSFLQAGCPSCRPTNSVKGLKGNSLTVVLP